ncbi:hypothetical protein MTQ01_07800 [Streptomyces sp. XM4193]|uniref:protealysin inhibitor emfourin n=1 Tax=Streptomyces sp. XM4193 TaxID=2929782 RepID=UPI001FFAACED|nr:protealysin inhibitor emfourin [Streptomyces sp. XM4193]MCK1795907.1 hypothetical protein [Streptomyces sp. XM4193]
MRISVMRTGGFGGIARRAELETEEGELAALVRTALAEGRAERPIGVPDGFHYEIEAEGTARYCADPRLTDAQQTVVARVLKEGRQLPVDRRP